MHSYLLVGIIATVGHAVPGVVYAWVVVFVMPVNSATNPILYTFSSFRLRRQVCCNFVQKFLLS